MGEVVVTGMGIISPLGNSVAEFSQNMFAGKSGIGPIRGGRVPKNFPVPYAGLVQQEGLSAPLIFDEAAVSEVPLFALFSLLSMQEALQDLPADADIDGVIYGTAEGVNFDLISDSLRMGEAKNLDFTNARAESALTYMKKTLERLGRKAPREVDFITVNSACASGNQAIGLAMHRIRSGQWKRALVGGVDARCNKANLMNFHMLGALTTAEVEPATASRPFAGDRTGFVRGEGAATLIIESLEEAKKRGAKILAKISGYANTTDAFRLTDGRDDGSSVIAAMKGAIADAGLSPADISAISAHGTSTKLNDRLETFAAKQVFGSLAPSIPMTSLKSQTGHSTVAAGAMEAVSAVLMLQEQMLAPTINYHVKDPECDLDYVPNTARKAALSAILSNNFGFGGQNACLVLAKGE